MALFWLLWHLQVLTRKVLGSRPLGYSLPHLGVLSGSCFLCLPFGGSVNHSGTEDSSWSTFSLMLLDPGLQRLAWLPWQSKRAGLGWRQHGAGATKKFMSAIFPFLLLTSSFL